MRIWISFVSSENWFSNQELADLIGFPLYWELLKLSLLFANYFIQLVINIIFEAIFELI
jgi:hypothetical protein